MFQRAVPEAIALREELLQGWELMMPRLKHNAKAHSAAQREVEALRRDIRVLKAQLGPVYQPPGPLCQIPLND